MSCKHPVRKLALQNRYDSAPDGYGGTNEWHWTVLACTGCDKEVKVWDIQTISVIRYNKYLELTGRGLTTEELKSLFLNNKRVYHYVDKTNNENDMVLRTVGKRTDVLAKKIKAKAKLINRHQKEYQQMLAEYNGE